MENRKNSVFRKPNEEDLKRMKYDPFMPCAFCEIDGIITIGAYRTAECYLCKECCFTKMTIEEYDEE